MRKKKILFLVLAIAAGITISGCGKKISSSEFIDAAFETVDQNSRITGVRLGKDSLYLDNIDEKYEEYGKQDDFEEMLSEKISDYAVSSKKINKTFQVLSEFEKGGYVRSKEVDDALCQAIVKEINENGIDVLDYLNIYEYKDERFKEAVQNYLEKRRTEIDSSEEVQLPQYIHDIVDDINQSEYLTAIECFPYEWMRDYIESRGEKVNTENNGNGFYNSNEVEYSDYWYDPLEHKRVSRGSVGTYHHISYEEIYGDLKLRVVSEEWWGLEKSNSDNRHDCDLDYKKENISSDLDACNTFLEFLPSDNLYAMECPNGNYVLFLIDNDKITYLSWYKFFTIQYK